MSIPFLSVTPKAVKVKVTPKFPADLRDGPGIHVNKQNGVWTVQLDYSDLPYSPVVPPNNDVVVYDPVSGFYTTVPAIQLGGGINTDSPQDGFTYGRNNGTWDRALSLANGGTVTSNVTFNGTATFTGVTTVPTPTASGQAANKGYVDTSITNAFSGNAGNALPLMNGVAAAGVSLSYSRQDHVHPTDTTRAPTASPTFTGAVTVSGTLVLTGMSTPPAITGNQNNYTPIGLGANTIMRLSATGPVNITGLAAQANGSVIALTNIGTATITLTNLDASSSAANQFNLGANVPLMTSQTALLFYDGASQQWRPMSGSGGGGGGASVYVQDTAPVGATAGSLWWQSSTGQLFLYYNDGTSTQWVFAASSATVSSAILAKNYIINGAMMVSQENGSTAGTANIYFPADQWNWTYSSGVVSAAQVAKPTPGGSPNRIRFTVTTALASPAAGDYAQIIQRLEGVRAADLLFGTAVAKTITVQFGCNGPAGTYGVALRNNAGNRFYVTTFTITPAQANTDIVVAVTIPGDVTGAWTTDNTIGIQLTITLTAGTTYQGAAGWGTAGVYTTSAQTNFEATVGNVFEFFDAGLYQGSSPPAFTVQDYAREFRDCCRYFYKRNSAASGTDVVGILQAYSTTNAWGKLFDLPVEMRAPPALTLSNVAHFSLATASGTSITCTGMVAGSWSSTRSLCVGNLGAGSGLVAGNACPMVAPVVGGWIAANARL